MQVTQTLNGSTSTWNSSASSIILEVAGPTLWETEVGVLSTTKDIILFNSGTELLSVSAPIFSNLVTVATPIYVGSNRTSPPWTISTGSYAKFGVTYVGNEVGNFNEAIWFATNESNSGTRYSLQVSVGDTSRIQLTPSYYTTTTTRPNENIIVRYDAVVVRNGSATDEDPQITAALTGNSAWTIEDSNNSSVWLRFDASRYGNLASAFTATLTASSPIAQSVSAISTATHQPDYVLNRSSATWMSTLTQPDVIIGARIDIVQTTNGSTTTQRTLTIGVGSGADGDRPLVEGALHFSEEWLNPIYSRLKVPNAFWRTVYQIPLDAANTTTDTIYNSRNYKIKTQEPDSRDYDFYFGNLDNTGSMFTVVLDPNDTVRISMNSLRETTNGEDTTLDQTLTRLNKAFYYYSVEDDAVRNTQGVGTTYQEVYINGVRTPTYLIDEFGVISATTNSNSLYFLGFDKNNNIITSLLRSPGT